MLVFLLGFQAYTIIVVTYDGRKGFPENFGNFERVRRTLEQQGPQETFSFAVVGDTQSVGTFERITHELRGEPLSFAVILGDFVQTGTKAHHRFFRAEWADELLLPYPVFVIAGNRDVAHEAASGDELWMSLPDFESVYGPTNFCFEYAGCLFVGLRILSAPFGTEESIDFLQSTLEKHRGKNQMIFVFMHIPPSISSAFEVKSFDNQERLIDLFDRYKVDYVFAGDYHGYARVRRNNTAYIVTGGGGAHLEKGNRYARFHHVVVLDVSDSSVSERILAVHRRTDIEDILERYAFTQLCPALRARPIVSAAINLLFLGALCLVAPRAIGRPKAASKKHSDDHSLQRA